MNTKTTPNGEHVSEFAALEAQIQNVQSDVHEIRGSTTRIADALVRLAVIEERHLATQQRVVSLEDRLVDTVTRVNELEKTNIKHTARFDGVIWTMRIVWTLIGAGALGLGAKLIHQAMG